MAHSKCSINVNYYYFSSQLISQKGFPFCSQILYTFSQGIYQTQKHITQCCFFFEIESRKKKKEFIFSKKRIKSKMTD